MWLSKATSLIVTFRAQPTSTLQSLSRPKCKLLTWICQPSMRLNARSLSVVSVKRNSTHRDRCMCFPPSAKTWVRGWQSKFCFIFAMTDKIIAKDLNINAFPVFKILN